MQPSAQHLRHKLGLPCHVNTNVLRMHSIIHTHNYYTSRAADPLTGLSLSCTASMEQAAYRAEADVIDQYFLLPTEQQSCSSQPTDTRTQINGCYVMRPWSSSRGCNTSGGYCLLQFQRITSKPTSKMKPVSATRASHKQHTKYKA